LLNLWEQNILLLDEEWVGRLLGRINFPLQALWKEKFDVPGLAISFSAPSVRLF
jgi:hypothetical protein